MSYIRERATLQNPLIVTLAMDDLAFARLNELRQRHFPPDRNFIPAHVTLFHKLPADREDRIRHDLASLCAAVPWFGLTVSGVRRLGRGVALTVESADLAGVREDMRRRWADWLGPQDRQGYRPHVTIQNKVDPSAAETLALAFEREPVSLFVEARGLILWRYLGGPWMHVETFAFAARSLA